eukprot:CFRG8375T1
MSSPYDTADRAEESAVIIAEIAQRLYERVPELVKHSDMDADMFVELLSLKKSQYIQDTRALHPSNWEGPHTDDVWVEWVTKAMSAFSAKIIEAEDAQLSNEIFQQLIAEIRDLWSGVREITVSESVLKITGETDSPNNSDVGNNESTDTFKKRIDVANRMLSNIALVSDALHMENHNDEMNKHQGLDVSLEDTGMDGDDEGLFVNDSFTSNGQLYKNQDKPPSVTFGSLQSGNGPEDEISSVILFGNNDEQNILLEKRSSLSKSSIPDLVGDQSVARVADSVIENAPPFEDGTTPMQRLNTLRTKIIEGQQDYERRVRARRGGTYTCDDDEFYIADKASIEKEILSALDRKQWLKVIESAARIKPGDTVRVNRKIDPMAKDIRLFRYGIYCGHANVVCLVVSDKGDHYIREVGLAEFMEGVTLSHTTLQSIAYGTPSVFSPVDTIAFARERVGTKYPFSTLLGDTDRTFCRECSTGFSQQLQLENGLPIAAGTVAIAGGAAGVSMAASMGTAGVSMGWVVAAGAASGIFAGAVLAVGAAAVVSGVAVKHYKVLQAERECRFAVTIIANDDDEQSETKQNREVFDMANSDELNSTREMLDKAPKNTPSLVAFRIDKKVDPPFLTVQELAVVLGLNDRERIYIYSCRQARYYDPVLEHSMLDGEAVPRICSIRITPYAHFDYSISLGVHPIR